MTQQDMEIQVLKDRVNCAVLLERCNWKLDKVASTASSLKYRRRKGEIIIVNHEGKGWWDPLSEARGDAFGLVQRLDPGLNFGQARQVLRSIAGVVPEFTEWIRLPKATPSAPVAERWAARPKLAPRSGAWNYLERQRGLPGGVLHAAAWADCIRIGDYDTPWFAHRDDAGAVTHVEARNRRYRGSLKGGVKRLFRFTIGPAPARLVLAEAPIDALSVAAFETIRVDTLYAATGGGMGPETIAAIETVLSGLAGVKGAELVSAADADEAGERYARRHQSLAQAAGVAFTRAAPPAPHGDWNDAWRAGRGE